MTLLGWALAGTLLGPPTAGAAAQHSDPKLPLETWSWRDAVIVASEGGRLLIDDLIFLRDSPREPPLLLSDSFSGCRGSRWIGAP